MANKVKKMMTFPESVYQVLESKAKKADMLATEYVRYLVFEDLKDDIFKSSHDDLNELRELARSAREEYQKSETKKVDKAFFDNLREL